MARAEGGWKRDLFSVANPVHHGRGAQVTGSICDPTPEPSAITTSVVPATAPTPLYAEQVTEKR